MRDRIAASAEQSGQHGGCELSKFDRTRIAAVFEIDGRVCVVRGLACYQRDDLLGNVLVVRPEADELGNPEIIFSEDEYNGRVVPDFRYGCDFCFGLGESDAMNGALARRSRNVPK